MMQKDINLYPIWCLCIARTEHRYGDLITYTALGKFTANHAFSRATEDLSAF